MNRILLTLIFIVLSVVCYGQDIAVKSNALYWATTTPNLGAEFGLGKKSTLDFIVGYNPWEFNDNKKLKHILVQPEYRHWLCEKFNGHFFGLHAHYAYYNAGGIKLPFGLIDEFQDHRYQGHLFGGGISYGYQWILGKRWNLEASIGVGYAHLIYDKYACQTCGEWEAKEHKNYFGPTKATLSIIYIID